MAAAPAAQAATALTDGVWQVFTFGAAGDPLGGEPFTFTVGAGGATLKITDTGWSGDRFTSTGLGDTSVPVGPQAGDLAENFDADFANPAFSSRSWHLTKGPYSFSGTVLVSALGSGRGGIQVTSVPEPSTYAMMALGLAGLGFAARRRQSV
jgi:hypothetical protein